MNIPAPQTRVKRAERRHRVDLIKKAFLTHPPTDLDTFTAALMTGVVEGARRQHNEDLHDKSYSGGGDSIRKEREMTDEWWGDVKADKERRRQGLQSERPKRHSTWHKTWKGKPDLDTKEIISTAGQVGYQKARDELSKLGYPDVIKVKCTRYQLLKWARLSDGNSKQRVDLALDRLTKPAGTMPPLVLSWKVMSSGRLLIKVEGEHLRPVFRPVPKHSPRPRKCRAVLWLWLFYWSINTHRINKVGITRQRLCAKLGIPLDKRTTRTLAAALDGVNRHLETFTVKQCLALLKNDVTVPEAIKTEDDDGRHVRIISISRRLPDEEVLENEREERRFRKSLDDAKSKPRRILKERPMTTQAQRDKRAQWDQDAAHLTKMYGNMRAKAE